MASNKKWIIAGSITLLVIFGASMGAGAFIGAYTKDEDSYIKIHMGDQTIDASTLNLGGDDATDETKAKLLEEQFYSAALFGSYNGTDQVNSKNLLSKDSEYGTPYVISNGTTNDQLREEFVKVKFLKDTQDSSVYKYLETQKSTSTNKFIYMQAMKQLINDAESNGINYPDVTGLQIISNKEFAVTWTAVKDALTNDETYLASVYEDIMSYVYLWQEPVQNAYDTIFTRELVYSSPSIVSTMTLDGSALWNLELTKDPDYKKLSEVTKDTNHVTASEWNTIFDNFATKSAITDLSTQDDQIDITGVTGFEGFQGIKFGSSAGSLADTDWTDWDNTWKKGNDESTSEHTDNGKYTNDDILQKGNYYVSSKAYAPGTGAIIQEDTTSDGASVSPTDGEAYVYAYSQLYPYVFQTVSGKDDTLQRGTNTYSLFAGKDGSSFVPTDGNENYIFDTWFKDLSLDGEIYVAESLFGHKDTLSTSALNFWNDKGYYIELSGTYETDLASYLPQEILLDE